MYPFAFHIYDWLLTVENTIYATFPFITCGRECLWKLKMRFSCLCDCNSHNLFNDFLFFCHYVGTREWYWEEFLQLFSGFCFRFLINALLFPFSWKKKSIRVNFLRNLLCSMHCPPDTRSQSCLATLCCCCIFFAWEYMYSSYVPCIYIVI